MIENKQEIWGLYGMLLDDFMDKSFTAKQIALHTNIHKKHINRIFHQLIKVKALEIDTISDFGTKSYKLCNDFFT